MFLTPFEIVAQLFNSSTLNSSTPLPQPKNSQCGGLTRFEKWRMIIWVQLSVRYPECYCMTGFLPHYLRLSRSGLCRLLEESDCWVKVVHFWVPLFKAPLCRPEQSSEQVLSNMIDSEQKARQKIWTPSQDGARAKFPESTPDHLKPSHPLQIWSEVPQPSNRCFGRFS